MLGRTAWLRHGFWNMVEHGLTRAADALMSLLLLWVLSPEVFSKLAMAQAIVAPLLFLFVSPEAVLYRDFSKWQIEGISKFSSRLHGLRTFAWGKGQFALFLSAAVAVFSTHWDTRFWSLLWAFSLTLAPQICGPDREFLRLNLQLRELNALTFYQKASLLGGTVFVALVFRNQLEWLAIAAAFSTVSTAVAARFIVRKSLRASGASEAAIRGKEGIGIVQTLSESLLGFSLWQHVNGVIVGWVQTMDLFFLGVLRFPARELGLYAAVLKLANFVIALPLALANTFAIWVGRRTMTEGLAGERLKLAKLTGLLFLTMIFQGFFLYLLSPWAFETLSHGRWLESERLQMLQWMKWILIGSTLFATAWPTASWLIARSDIRKLFLRFYLPWGCISAAIYFSMIRWNGLDAAALANVFVSMVYLALLWLRFRST